MRKVPIHLLSSDMKLAKAVYGPNQSLLLQEGVELKPKYINRLKIMNISAVYIDSEYAGGIEAEDIIKEETRQRAQEITREVLEEAKGTSKGSSLLLDQKEIKSIINDIIKELTHSSNIVVNLSEIRTTDNYTFTHSVNVAVLSVLIGSSLSLTRSDLEDLGFGALVHDLGKVRVPDKILNKPGKLSPDEFDEVKKHSEYGYEMLKKQNNISAASIMTAYQHHERSDGSGYPHGLKGGKIHLYARIAAVADVYDALVSDRPYRKGMMPHEVIEMLQANAEGFDLEILQAFLQYIAAYPEGTMVLLSNDYAGVILQNRTGFPTRPIVRVLFEKTTLNEVEPFEIDLVEKIDIVVNKVYTEEELKTIQGKNSKLKVAS